VDDNKAKTTAGTPASATPPPAKGTVHPYPVSDQDLVAVEVVYPQGVRQNGRNYRPGETLTLKRGLVTHYNKHKPVYRVLRTVRYANGPADQAEEQPAEGPLNLD